MKLRFISKICKQKFENESDDPIMMNTDESTQASLRLMDKIRASRLFTMPTSLGEMKLTQRDTNLCVPIAGSRLIRIVRFDAMLLKH